MSWTLTTSGAAILKAGLNANSTITASGAALAKWCDEAEGLICAKTRIDWVANYSSIGANFKPILDDVAASLIAKEMGRHWIALRLMNRWPPVRFCRVCVGAPMYPWMW